MRLFSAVIFSSTVLLSSVSTRVGAAPERQPGAQSIFGFRDATAENAAEARFLAVPDPKLAEQHLRTLTQVPHMAGTPEDKATADYVAQKFRDAGLDTEIVEYKVWMNYPEEISVDLTAPAGVEMHAQPLHHRVVLHHQLQQHAEPIITSVGQWRPDRVTRLSIWHRITN